MAFGPMLDVPSDGWCSVQRPVQESLVVLHTIWPLLTSFKPHTLLSFVVHNKKNSTSYASSKLWRFKGPNRF